MGGRHQASHRAGQVEQRGQHRQLEEGVLAPRHGAHRHHRRSQSALANPRPFEGGVHEAASWRTAMWVVLGSMMGVGLLSMPAAFQRLGWLPATACIIAFAGAAVYAGVLYARVMAELPWVSSFHELGARTAGPWGIALVWCTAYLAIFTVPAVLHLACTQALQQLFEESMRPPMMLSGFAIALAVMPLTQLRRLADVGWLGAAGSIVMCGAMALLVFELTIVEPPTAQGAQTHMFEHAALLPATVGVMDILFAYNGQINWPRFLSAMGPHRRQFGYSSTVALSIMMPTVLTVGAVGYMTRGGSINLTDPITKQLAPGIISQLINAGILVSVLVAYVLDVNVAAQVFLEIVRPKLFKPAGSHGHTIGSRISAPRSHLQSHRISHSRSGTPSEHDTTEPLLPLPPTHAMPMSRAGKEHLRDHPQGSHDLQPYSPPSPVLLDNQSPLAIEQQTQLQPTGAQQQVQLQQPQPQQQQREVQTPRTVSEAERALGTGVVVQALTQAVQGSSSPASTRLAGVPEQQHSMHSTPTRAVHAADPRQQQQAARKPGADPLPIAVHMSPATEAATDTTATASPNRAVAGGQPTSSKHHWQRAVAAAGKHRGGAHEPAGATTDHHAHHRAHAVDEEQGHGGHQSEAEEENPHPRNDVGMVRLLWGMTTVSLVLMAWMVGYIWPSFAEVEGVVASVGGVSSIFLLPSLFALRTLHLPTHERMLCVLLCLASLAMTGLGLFASIQQMHNKDV